MTRGVCDRDVAVLMLSCAVFSSRISHACLTLIRLTSFLYRRGYTPLHEAAKYGRLDIVRFLESSGADVNKQDGYCAG